jgi:hypothetical protein
MTHLAFTYTCSPRCPDQIRIPSRQVMHGDSRDLSTDPQTSELLARHSVYGQRRYYRDQLYKSSIMSATQRSSQDTLNKGLCPTRGKVMCDQQPPWPSRSRLTNTSSQPHTLLQTSTMPHVNVRSQYAGSAQSWWQRCNAYSFRVQGFA